jgi:hypothetical protein
MTKAARRDTMRAVARLLAQARVNAGDATTRGRTAEAAAWLRVASWLGDVERGLAAGLELASQPTLF